MLLTRAGYLADFYVYPGVSAGLVALAIAPQPRHWPALAGAFLAGLAAWTLVEYILHRWLFHRAPWFRAHHQTHHDDPKAFVGTPTWLSLLAALVLVLLPATLVGGMAMGCSFTAGFTLAYVWYAAVHYWAHHGHAAPGSYFHRLKRRHAIHHHGDVAGNFGVTTLFWDRVLATRLP
jgi:sterol desaturase/sphingolipid hydroxylase (fatty acid hydroxylase superfamily)